MFYIIHPKAQLEICILGNPFFSNQFHSSIHFRDNGNMEVQIKKHSHSEKLIFPANDISKANTSMKGPNQDSIKVCSSTSIQPSHDHLTESPLLQQEFINSNTNSIVNNICSQEYELDKEPTEIQNRVCS